jgi:hypothetical protein
MRRPASCLGCGGLVVIGTYDRLEVLCVPTEAEADLLRSTSQPIGRGIGYHNCPGGRSQVRKSPPAVRPPFASGSAAGPATGSAPEGSRPA